MIHMKKSYIQPACSEICFGTHGSVLNTSVGTSTIESFIVEDDSLEWN